MNSCLILIIGTDAREYPGDHPFTDGYAIRHFPTVNNVFSAIQMLEDYDLDKNVIIFQSSSIVDSRIFQFMESIDPNAEIAFLGDCEESLLAPRFVNKIPGQTQLRVFSPCCMSAIFIRSDYLKRLRCTSDSSSMLLLIKNNLRSGTTFGVRAFPPLIHCSPAKPHRKSTINWEEVGKNDCWNMNNYLLLLVIVVVVIIIIVCLILLFRTNSKCGVATPVGGVRVNRRKCALYNIDVY